MNNKGILTDIIEQSSIENMSQGWKQESAGKTPIKQKKKIKNRLQMLIRKHFFDNKKKKFDITYIMKVVNMQDKLESILPKRTS